MCIGYMAEQDRKPTVKSETLFISPPFSSLKTKGAAGSQKTNNKIHRHELEVKYYLRWLVIWTIKQEFSVLNMVHNNRFILLFLI